MKNKLGIIAAALLTIVLVATGNWFLAVSGAAIAGLATVFNRKRNRTL